jgi:hypothetical protein
MKTFFTATALTLALMSGARAAEIPEAMRGEWCDMMQPNNGTIRYYLPCDLTENRNGMMTVTKNDVDYHEEWSCKVIKIIKFDTEPYKGIKNYWGPGYRMTFRCSGDRTTHQIVEEWQTAKTQLIITTKK